MIMRKMDRKITQKEKHENKNTIISYNIFFPITNIT